MRCPRCDAGLLPAPSVVLFSSSPETESPQDTARCYACGYWTDPVFERNRAMPLPPETDNPLTEHMPIMVGRVS